MYLESVYLAFVYQKLFFSPFPIIYLYFCFFLFSPLLFTIYLQSIYYYFFFVIKYSFNAFSRTSVGLSTTRSLPDWFFGKAITSRILDEPTTMAHNLSKPNANPACGGHPILSAFNKWPNNWS